MAAVSERLAVYLKQSGVFQSPPTFRLPLYIPDDKYGTDPVFTHLESATDQTRASRVHF
jgi:hypothetical protein